MKSYFTPRWKFRTGFWYRASTAEGFAVLARYWHNKHGLPPEWFRKLTWLEVVHRYWRDTGHRYHPSTEIFIGSVLALVRCRLLANTWYQDWGCTMPVPRQPLAWYKLSSTGFALCLQLPRYYVVSKYWHESDFSTWAGGYFQLLIFLSNYQRFFHFFFFFNNCTLFNYKNASEYFPQY